MSTEAEFTIRCNYGDNNSFEHEGTVEGRSAAHAVANFLERGPWRPVPFEAGQQIFVSADDCGVGFLSTLQEIPRYTAIGTNRPEAHA